MSSQPTPSVTGEGSPDLDLGPNDLRAIVENALSGISPGTRVLAIIPDKARDDNTNLLFPFAAEVLAARQVAQFDALVAQGTHRPMTVEEKRTKVGLLDGRRAPGLGHIYDHLWNRPEELAQIGELSAGRVR